MREACSRSYGEYTDLMACLKLCSSGRVGVGSYIAKAAARLRQAGKTAALQKSHRSKLSGISSLSVGKLITVLKNDGVAFLSNQVAEHHGYCDGELTRP